MRLRSSPKFKVLSQFATGIEERKDTDKILQQKIAALKKKLEAEYIEKEKTIKSEAEKKSKECDEKTVRIEKTLHEQMTLRFQSYLFVAEIFVDN